MEAGGSGVQVPPQPQIELEASLESWDPVLKKSKALGLGLGHGSEVGPVANLTEAPTWLFPEQVALLSSYKETWYREGKWFV